MGNLFYLRFYLIMSEPKCWLIKNKKEFYIKMKNIIFKKSYMHSLKVFKKS